MLKWFKAPTKQIKHWFLNQGLQFRLALCFLLLSLVPLCFLGYFSYHYTANIIQNIVSRYTNDVIDEININIFLNFKTIDDISKVLLNNNTIKDILAKRQNQGNRDYREDQTKILTALRSILNSNDYITSIYILPHNNNNIFAVGDVAGNYGLTLITEDYQKKYRKTPLYQETITEVNNYKWWPPQNILGQEVFVLTRKLYDLDYGLLGVVVIHVHKNILENVALRINSGKSTNLYLVDEKGRYIYHSDPAFIGSQIRNHEVLQKMKRKPSGNFIYKEKNERIFAVYSTFFVTDWKLLAVTPYRKLVSDAAMIRSVTLIIIFLCLSLVLFLSVLIAKGILIPVKKLVYLLKQGSQGDLSIRFSVRYHDEIGELGSAFNQMMANTHNLMNDLEKKEQQKALAEIKVLESQINPHFLYNTLASIYWMATAEGSMKIGEMVSALSNFLRLGLNKGKEFTTVKKEVEHVQNYLSIQKYRFGDDFDYQVKVEEKIIGCQTIKLILQPLVENSLVHGIEGLGYQCFINVEVFEENEQVIFRVSDNGRGIANLTEASFDSLINNGYGLKNIRERLKLYFNNNYTLTGESEPGVKTVITISIPALEFSEEKNNV